MTDVRFHTPWLGPDEIEFTESSLKIEVPGWCSAVFLLFALLSLVVFVIAVGGNAEAFSVLITVPILLGITFVAARRIAIIDGNPKLPSIIMAGLCVKFFGTLARYWVSSGLYGTGDFYDYDKRGRRVAAALREGHLFHLSGRLAGTNFMRYMTGFIYAVTPSRMMSGFAVYGWLSFIGLLFFWRAYRVAVSRDHDVKYLVWLILLPSLAYWPSAIGKDAFMVLAAGVAAYGVACVLASRTSTGVIAVSAGIGGMIMVRPHFALAVCGGLALAVLLRRQKGGFFRVLINLAFVAALSMFVLQAAHSFFGFSALNRTSVEQTLNDASAQSLQGGSQFAPVIVTSPAKVPLAALTVLYRPLPYEAHSPQEMLTALEGVLLLALTVRALRRSIKALRHGRDLPYLLYCLGAVLVFIIVFSGFSNFGLLARERGVIQPLFIVFLSLPKDIESLLPKPASKNREQHHRQLSAPGHTPW